MSLEKVSLGQPTPAQADDTRTAQGEAVNMPPALMLNQGMPVEVMRDFDTVLLFGRLVSAGQASLTIGRIPGEKSFPVCRAGSAVLVRGYDEGMDPVLLRGRVASCSEVRWVVGDLERILCKARRGGVRYPLTPPAGVCVLDNAADARPQPCQMLNISTGGACIVAPRLYQAGQTLRLQIQLSGAPGQTAVHRCRVIRATPRSGGCFEYGLAFTQMDEEGRGALAQEIQAIHEKTEKKLRA